MPGRFHRNERLAKSAQDEPPRPFFLRSRLRNHGDNPRLRGFDNWHLPKRPVFNTRALEQCPVFAGHERHRLHPPACERDIHPTELDSVGNDGSNPTTVTTNPSATNYVVGRYAYAIYHEGGLLDANVAGYYTTFPSSFTTNGTVGTYCYKEAQAFADLTQLPPLANAPVIVKFQFLNDIVGWRNYASAAASGNLASGYTFFCNFRHRVL